MCASGAGAAVDGGGHISLIRIGDQKGSAKFSATTNGTTNGTAANETETHFSFGSAETSIAQLRLDVLVFSDLGLERVQYRLLV